MKEQNLYGLIGYPLHNSFSVNFFTNLFTTQNMQAVYQNYPINHLNQFHQLIKSTPQLKGLNVTIPYKKEIIPYLTKLHQSAAVVEAVNTIKIEGEQLIGYNTDVVGFEKSILPLLKPWHQKALVLGTGGAALAAFYVLNKLGISYTPVSSNNLSFLNYQDITKAVIRTHQVIIQCTPLGTSAYEHETPNIPYQYLTPMHLAFDMVYHPEETPFLLACKNNGAAIKNGLEMLHLQAMASWDIWQN
jgi:shikimate dehydrogenase